MKSTKSNTHTQSHSLLKIDPHFGHKGLREPSEQRREQPRALLKVVPRTCAVSNNLRCDANEQDYTLYGKSTGRRRLPEDYCAFQSRFSRNDVPFSQSLHEASAKPPPRSNFHTTHFAALASPVPRAFRIGRPRHDPVKL